MASGNDAPSFNDFIQQGRKKRENDKLAREIFGKNRRQSAPARATGNRNASPFGTMSSRAGVTKKQNVVERMREVDKSPRSPSTNTRRSELQNRRLYRSLFNSSDADINIRGRSTVYYPVIAKNFAPGTTEADLEAVFAPVGGEIESCKILTENPTCIAETVFTDKAGAERVIAKFNNKRADGCILEVFMKDGPRAAQRTSSPDRDTMELDDERDSRRMYEQQRTRRAEANYDDGRYGFGGDSTPYQESSRRDGRYRGNGNGGRNGRDENFGRLVSDSLLRKGRGSQR